MSKDFLLESHYIAKAIDGIIFPISKADIIDKYGEKDIKVSNDNNLKLKKIIDKIQIQEFNSAAELYSAIYSKY